jgi:hypothetical protein|tara:strand:- start:379 stop:531 length:153 start_codon:yes stop_codon:yes gene_type:complete
MLAFYNKDLGFPSFAHVGVIVSSNSSSSRKQKEIDFLIHGSEKKMEFYNF